MLGRRLQYRYTHSSRRRARTDCDRFTAPCLDAKSDRGCRSAWDTRADNKFDKQLNERVFLPTPFPARQISFA